MGNDDNKEDQSSLLMLDIFSSSINTLSDDNQYNLKDKENYGNKTLQQFSSISNIIDSSINDLFSGNQPYLNHKGNDNNKKDLLSSSSSSFSTLFNDYKSYLNDNGNYENKIPLQQFSSILNNYDIFLDNDYSNDNFIRSQDILGKMKINKPSFFGLQPLYNGGNRTRNLSIFCNNSIWI